MTRNAKRNGVIIGICMIALVVGWFSMEKRQAPRPRTAPSEATVAAPQSVPVPPASHVDPQLPQRPDVAAPSPASTFDDAARKAVAAAYPVRPPRHLAPLGSYKRLIERSRADDLSATCRLGAGLGWCSDYGLSQTQTVIDKWRTTLANAAPGSAEAANAAGNMQSSEKHLTWQLAQCDGWPRTSDPPAWKYLFDAASSGHVPSMLRFAAHPPLDPSADRDAEGFSVYRQHAGEFLERAARSGNRQAISLLAAAYSGLPIGILKQPVLPVNLQPAMRYLIVTDELNIPGVDTRYMMGGTLLKVEKQLTKEQIESATREAGDFMREIEATRKARGADDVTNVRVMVNGEECG